MDIMKIEKTSSGTYKVLMTSQEWRQIGEQHGWLPKFGQKIADEIIERQQGETVEQAIEQYMQFAGDDMVQHEEEGIGIYEMWGSRMHDPGSTNSSIKPTTVAVDVTDLQGREHDMVPHSVNGRSVQVEWTAQFQKSLPVQGKVFAIYLIQ